MFDRDVHIGTAGLIYKPPASEEIGFDVLLMRRHPKASHGEGQWAPPGGWIDMSDESPEDAVMREVYEETGLHTRHPELRDAVTNFHPEPINSVVCLFYELHLDRVNDRPRIMEPEKCTDLRWVHRTRVKELDLFSPMKSFVWRAGW